MSVLSSITRAAGDVVRAALVRPVEDGRPRPRTWPPGLIAISVGTGILYLWLSLLAAGAAVVREESDLVVSHATGITMPDVALPFLLGSFVWCMILLHTAALHTSWWPKLALGLVGVMAFGFFSAPSWTNPVLTAASLAVYGGLGVFTLTRRNASYAWWEFPIVGGFVTVAFFLPWVLPGYGAMFGADHRVVALEGAFGTIAVLAVPALMVAALAPAQITVTAGETLASRPLPVWIRVAMVVAVVVWRGYDVWALATDSTDPLPWPDLVDAGIILALGALLAGVLLRRSRRASLPGPSSLPEHWSRLAWPLAMAVGWIVIAVMPVAVLRVVIAATPWGERYGEPLWTLYLSYGTQVLRFLIGCVALAIAWRIAARGRLAEALLLAVFFLYSWVPRLGHLTGLSAIGTLTPEAIAAVSSGIALLLLVGLAVVGRLSRRRLTGLLTVLLLGALFPHRTFLDDPLSALLGFSGLAVLLFGLVWQLLVNGDYTNGSSRALPQPARVLLYLANSLFAVTFVAWHVLAREAGRLTRPQDWADLGDAMFGVPLFVAAALAGLAMAVGPQPDDT